jgi:hypothetical protein
MKDFFFYQKLWPRQNIQEHLLAIYMNFLFYLRGGPRFYFLSFYINHNIVH